jgi:hypothetical protein
MEGMEEGGKDLKVNNGGERSLKTWLAQGVRRGIYRWGKSGRWKQIATKFGRKSGAAGLQAGLFGGQSASRQKAPR